MPSTHAVHGRSDAHPVPRADRAGGGRLHAGFYVDWWAHLEVEGGPVAASVVEGLIAPETLQPIGPRPRGTNARAAAGVLEADLCF